MPDSLALHVDILRILNAPPATGLRVAELRAALTTPIDPAGLQTALTQLLNNGKVMRDPNGRWAVPAAQRAPSAPPVATGRERRRTIPADSRPPLPPARLPEVADAGIPPRAADGSFQLDATQYPIVHAAPGARLIVEAGPGHGKTAVACARVAHLVDHGVPGTQILLLSFTRTAVREMRQRIRELARAGTDVADISILTIDSWATRLRTGFLGEGAMTGSFDAGIRRTLSLLRAPTSDLADRLSTFRHILVDEAQDLVGLRAQLIEALLRAVSPECGFTVFLDPAQAIYDWAEDELEEGQEPVRFAELLRSVPGVQPPVPLGHLHRTADPDLRRLLLGARRLVLDGEVPRRASTLRSILAERMTPGRPEWRTLVPSLPDDALILFRRRGPVLDASAWLAAKGIPHRLRMGGLPQPVAPWVAALLHDAFEKNNRLPSLPRESCEVAWNALGEGYLTRGWTFERAWPVLRQMGAEGRARIDVRKVADALLLGRVPDDLHTRELGSGGPVLGTVHGSKGREGSRVLYMVPAAEDHDGEDSEASEARVLYVAITRAKERLDLHDGGRCYYGKVNGRDWQKAKNDRVRFEIGREGDLNAARAMVLAPGDAARHQQQMRGFDGAPRPVTALRREGRFATAWDLLDARDGDTDGVGSAVLSVLNEDADRDLFNVLSEKGLRRTTDEFRHLYQLDITTTPLHQDHPYLDHLPEPWRTLRLILSPVVVGLGSTYARKR
jgi:hypothetical protein